MAGVHLISKKSNEQSQTSLCSSFKLLKNTKNRNFDVCKSNRKTRKKPERQ